MAIKQVIVLVGLNSVVKSVSPYFGEKMEKKKIDLKEQELW